MLSAVEDRQVIDAAFRRGASAYIRKSVNPFDLPAAIRQIVEGTVIHALARLDRQLRRPRAPPACPRRRRPSSPS